MLIGRFLVIIPVLAIAGCLAAKKRVPASAGTFPTDGALFVGLLVGVILIVGGLTFFPALALGPIAEHLAMIGRPDLLNRSANMARTATALLAPDILVPAIGSTPSPSSTRAQLVRNPVMFVVEVVALLTTVLFLRDLATGAGGIGFQLPDRRSGSGSPCCSPTSPRRVAEGRGKAQAASLRATRTDIVAKRLSDPARRDTVEAVPARDLEPGDVVLVEAGDLIPADGEVIEGVASVNEAAITGECAPVIREAGGDRSAVTGGTRVLSDWIMVRVTRRPGSTFLDRMIALVEGAERQKTPNEIALNILLVGLTIIFLIAVATIPSFAAYAGGAIGGDRRSWRCSSR